MDRVIIPYSTGDTGCENRLLGQSGLVPVECEFSFVIYSGPGYIPPQHSGNVGEREEECKIKQLTNSSH